VLVTLFLPYKMNAIKRFVGKYHSTKNYYNRPYVIKEVAHLEIKQNNDQVVFSVSGHEVLKNGAIFNVTKKDTLFDILTSTSGHSKNYCFSRWDGSFVNEGQGEGLFRNTTYNAQIFTIFGNILIRRVYLNYSFKGPFGGYWCPSEYSLQIWRRN